MGRCHDAACSVGNHHFLHVVEEDDGVGEEVDVVEDMQTEGVADSAADVYIVEVDGLGGVGRDVKAETGEQLEEFRLLELLAEIDASAVFVVAFVGEGDAHRGILATDDSVGTLDVDELEMTCGSLGFARMEVITLFIYIYVIRCATRSTSMMPFAVIFEHRHESVGGILE